MTDKQIIIDGVDVSGCDFLATKDDYCSYSGITYAYKGQCMCSDEEMCKEHPNCFYKKNLKKLKAKEQECERLDNEAQNLFTEKTNLDIELDQLKAENKHLNDLLNQALKELEKTRETLTEIKQIASREAETSRYNGSSTWKQILQKISEVVDEN